MTDHLALAACVITLFVSAHSHARDSEKSSGFSSPDYQAALDGIWRSAENRARDPYRHPVTTLQFFSLDRGQTAIEITPSEITQGNGWYSEILGPMLQESGHYIAVIYAKVISQTTNAASPGMRKAKSTPTRRYEELSARRVEPASTLRRGEQDRAKYLAIVDRTA